MLLLDLQSSIAEGEGDESTPSVCCQRAQNLICTNAGTEQRHAHRPSLW